MPNLPRASLIVLNWNRRDLLARCLPSIVGQDYPDVEVLLVDNGSTDGSLEWVASAYPQVRQLPQRRNLGYAAGMNAGLAEAQGDVIAFLNNDVIPRPDWLRALAQALAGDARIGVAGCKLLYPVGQPQEPPLLQHAGGIVRYPLALTDHRGFRQPDQGQFDELKDVDYVTGAALLARRRMLDEIGSFDEGFHFYFEDADLCLRARAAGWRVVYVPQAVAVHLESATVVRDSPAYYAAFHRGRLRFVLKHYTPEQFLNDFVPAERNRWPDRLDAAEREPLRQAYHEAAGDLDAILATRPAGWVAPTVTERLRHALYELAAVGAPRPVDGLMDHLQAHAVLREHVFVSHLPIVGPLIAHFRSLWNAVSTKWYVRPLAAQQSEFNALAVQTLSEVLRLLGKAQADLDENHIQLEETQANLIAADRQITALTHRLAVLEQRLRQVEDHADRVL